MPVIKFYPTDDVIGGFAPAPIPAATQVPEWFRKLPPYQSEHKEIVKDNPHPQGSKEHKDWEAGTNKAKADHLKDFSQDLI